MSKHWHQTASPEKVAEMYARRRKAYASRSKKQLAQSKAYNRKRYLALIASLTPMQLAARRRKARHPRYLLTREDRARFDMLRNAKMRARRKHLAFDITAQDIKIPKLCPVLKKAFTFGAARSTPLSPSLDRIDPRKGYVRGNIVVISLRANQIKSDASYADVLAVARWLRKQC